MTAGLTISFTLTDGSTIQMTSPLGDSDAIRFATWAAMDASTIPNEMDANGKPIPRTVPWALKRLSEMFLVQSFASLVAWEHAQAVAAIAAPTPIQIKIS